MAITEFKAALNQVATERGIDVEDVLESIRSALESAYRKDYDEELEGEIVVELDSDTGEAKILLDGKDVTPAGFGRIAAQTAKQVILQKIRETEKQVIYDEYSEKIGTLINGTIFRIEETGKIVLDLGKVHGILPQSEQVDTESYRPGQRLKVYVKDVKKGTKGTEVIVSRADADFVVKLFEQEVPEITQGTVIIEAIAREAGSRTKMAVYSTDEKIDPVGSCVGQKGVRVQSIISELYGEKIDVIPYSPQIEKFIAASLSPARVTNVEIVEDEKRAIVTVPEDQQSLAIGREGQNARLANKLTGWKIDVKGVKSIFDLSNTENTSKDENVVGVWDAAIEKLAQEEKKDEDEEKGQVQEEMSEDNTDKNISEEVTDTSEN